MKKLLISACLYVVATSCLAAEPSVKQLLAEIVSIEVASEQNEQRLTELFEHSDQGVSTSAKIRIAALYWQSGRLQQAQQVLEDISQSFDDYNAKYQVESLLTWASFELRRNRFVEAEQYAKQAHAIAETSHTELVGNTSYILGAALRAQRKELEAKRYFETALVEFEQDDNEQGVFNVLNSLGIMYKDTGDLANGIKYLLQAREVVEGYGGKGHLAAVFYNLADVFMQSDEPKQAAEYYQKALALDLELGDLGNAAYDYTGLASALMESEQYEIALQNNQKAIQLVREIDAPQELSRAYLQQSTIYQQLGDQNNRFNSLLLAEKSAAESKSPYQIMSVNINKAEYDLELNKLPEARDDLLGALEVAEQLSLDNDKVEIHQLLATTYQGLSDYEKGYFHLNLSYELQQKLNSEDRREKSERYKRDLNLLEQQIKVSELQQTEAEQAQVIKAQETVQQRLMIIIVATAIVFIALLTLLLQRRKLATLKADLLKQSLQQKQQFFADISHELRTPLTVFKLKMEELEYEIADDPKSVYQLLHDRIDSFNHLINDISLLAQNDQGELELNFESVDLESFFKLRAEDLTALAKSHNLSVETNLAVSSGDSAEFDPARIRQVLANLFSNACRYTNTPGQIHFDVSLHQDHVQIVIEDSAPNLSQQQLDKVFERLYRADKSRSRKLGGSGLGLSICQNLVQAHKGEITASPSQLGGVKFIINLPVIIR